MFAVLAQTFGWSHEDIMKMTPRQTRAYFRQVAALHAAEQQRWLVVAATAASQNGEAVEKLSQDLIDIQQGKIRRPRKSDLITTDPKLISMFINNGGLHIGT